MWCVSASKYAHDSEPNDHEMAWLGNFSVGLLGLGARCGAALPIERACKSARDRDRKPHLPKLKARDRGHLDRRLLLLVRRRSIGNLRGV